MEKLVVIIDDMPEYGRRLALYLNACRTFPYRAVLFATAEEAKGYMKTDGVYAVVASEAMEKEVLEVTLGTKVKLFRLSENKDRGDISLLYRYGSVKEIVRRLTEQKEVEKRIPVLGFFSPAGGCEAELLSREIAKRLGRKGKVLYLSLFPFGSCKRTGEDGLSEALYFVRQEKDGARVSLQHLLRYEENMDSIGPVRWYTDLDSVAKEDIKALLQSDRWDTEYEAFFVAVGAFDRTGRNVLNCCDSVLVPVWETEQGRNIQEDFRRQLKESGETKLYSGMLEFSVKEALGQVSEETFAEAIQKGGEAIAGSCGGNTKADAGTVGSVG